MRCAEAQEELSAYLDGELTAEEQAAMCAHLASCAACAAAARALARAVQAVKELPPVPAPPGLPAQVVARIEEARAQERRVPLWRILWPTAAAIFLAVGIGLVSHYREAPHKNARREVARVTEPSSRLEPVAFPAPTADELTAFQAPAEPPSEKAKDAAVSRQEAAFDRQDQLRAAPEAASGGPIGATTPAAPAAMKRAGAPPTTGPVRERRMMAKAEAALDADAAMGTAEIRVLAVDPKKAYDQALALATERGWRRVDPPARRDAEGLADAEAPVLLVLQIQARDLPPLRAALARLASRVEAAERGPAEGEADNWVRVTVRFQATGESR